MDKKYLIISLLLSSGVALAGTNGRINLQYAVESSAIPEKKVEVFSTSSAMVLPLQVPTTADASVDRKTVVLYEDFDAIPDGDTETIPTIGERYVDCIASHYFEPGRYIDHHYTPGSGTWEGDWVYAGKGGTVILQSYNPWNAAVLNTPLGDYSGDVTVTICARYAQTFWGADTEVGYDTSTGTSLTLGAYISGYDKYDQAATDMSNSTMGSGRIYKDDGWQEITFKFHNESANKDGFLCFFSNDAIEIDWIKITDDNTYLANPVVKEPTDFTNEGFTINWDPVRRAFNYYIDLYKAVYSAEKGIEETFEFEDRAFPEWLSSASGEWVEGEGFNGTTAFLLNCDGEDGALVSDGVVKNIDSFSTLVKFQKEDEESDLVINYDVYGENGWEPYGYLKCDGRWIQSGGYYKIVINDEKFANKYSRIRIYAEGTSEANKIYIDDVYLYVQRPYDLERVYTDFSAFYDPDNDDYAYNYYTTTGCGTAYDPQDPGRKGTSYTFVGLDPESEYWYRVRSHNGYDFTIGEKHHAFGVAAPQLLPASNVTDDSYTANWKDAPKAQKYILTNYSGKKMEVSNDQYSLMWETFTNCYGMSSLAGMGPLNNTEECYLDQFTDLKGWRGKNNTIGQNMIGCADYSGGYVLTPVMLVNPKRGAIMVYIEVMGKPGDSIYVSCLKSGATGVFAFDDNGYMGGWFEIPVVEGEQVKFQSYNSLAFAVRGFEVVQAVEKGDIIRLFDSEVEVAAGKESYTFSNLEKSLYSYSVISCFTLEKETTYSTSSDVVFINGETNGLQLIKTDSVSSIEEIARYTPAGVKVGKDYKGLVVIMMNDGTVRKEYVK